ncbi:MAG: CopD family protein [Castellaniella sp.]|nr:CopD family protein [Castellaniella sp.]
MSVVSLAANWLQPFFSFWVDATLAIVGGVLVMSGAVPQRTRKPLLAVLRVATVVLGLGLVAYLGVATVAMTDTGPADFVGYLWIVLTGTDFGVMVWVAACAWLMLMLTAFSGHVTWQAVDCPPKWALVLWGSGGVVLAYARAATGHAADQGFFSLAVMAHTAHVLAACLWVGSAVVSVRLLSLWKSWTLSEQSRLAHRLSALATIVVPLVAATGVVDAFRTLGEAAHVWGSPYLWILLAKLALVAVVVILGSWNRWIWMVPLDAGRVDALRGFATVLAVEAIALCGVLLLAAKLGTMATPT